MYFCRILDNIIKLLQYVRTAFRCAHSHLRKGSTMKILEESGESLVLSTGGLLFEGKRTHLQHGDRIIYHSHGYQHGEVEVGFLEVKRDGKLLERQVGDTRFPFDNRFAGSCPGKGPANYLFLVLQAMANMANLDVSGCSSQYKEGAVETEEYKLLEPGCIMHRSGAATRP